ncbi:hypothetical protein AAL_08014 [Moelleriella libera RCEF 2490]|uniref:Uncharacterized protein n=1 Tax=Moelleriella libera RCEF 2490 TaxID=1081109 RepID=A0A162I5B6_9HYPO|nr:hypothetical protein AAL_08014 [Moelleriella libera RCEF 2490]
MSKCVEDIDTSTPKDTVPLDIFDAVVNMAQEITAKLVKDIEQNKQEHEAMSQKREEEYQAREKDRQEKGKQKALKHREKAKQIQAERDSLAVTVMKYEKQFEDQKNQLLEAQSWIGSLKEQADKKSEIIGNFEDRAGKRNKIIKAQNKSVKLARQQLKEKDEVIQIMEANYNKLNLQRNPIEEFDRLGDKKETQLSPRKYDESLVLSLRDVMSRLERVNFHLLESLLKSSLALKKLEFGESDQYPEAISTLRSELNRWFEKTVPRNEGENQ